jgi:uncharacterized cupin superfamily protein
MENRKHAFTATDAEQVSGASYPPPFHEIGNGRTKAIVGERGGLNQFGVNIVTLPPGSGSAQRHWHEQEDEFAYMISGEVVLITNDGEEIITAGMMMGWPANVANGHHLVNRSNEDAVYMEVGTRVRDDVCHYPDIDLHLVIEDGDDEFQHNDGTPY